jgi:hypothetical protein
MKVAQHGTLGAYVEGIAHHVDSGRAIALLLMKHGTLILRRNDRGRIWADVVGVDSPEGIAVLGEIGGSFEDIACEVCVMADPPAGVDLAELGPPRLHRRRS